jgi:hypothetical protein
VIGGFQEFQQSRGDRCHAGGEQQGFLATFQGCQTFFTARTVGLP